MANRHMKRFSIANHQRNANQNEISPYTVRMVIIKKTIIINVGEDVEKRKPLYTVGGNVNWCSQLCKTVWRFLIKLKIEISYDPAILPRVYI